MIAEASEGAVSETLGVHVSKGFCSLMASPFPPERQSIQRPLIMNEQSIDADGDLVLQRRRSVAQVSAPCPCLPAPPARQCWQCTVTVSNSLACELLPQLPSPPPPLLPATCVQGPRERGDDDLVLSEVHMDSLRPAAGEAAASTFRFPAPSPLDAAGSTGSIALTIRHAMATPLRSVGLQVWRGALLLADLLLQRGPAALAGATALELGAGPGLAGLVLSRLAGTVFLTGGPGVGPVCVGCWACCYGFGACSAMPAAARLF